MRKLLVLVAASTCLWACGQNEHAIPVIEDADAGCATPCGQNCCSADQRCVAESECCTPSCAGKTCGSDGCGGSCGECEQGWTCGAAGTCECPAESDEAFCARLDVVCGTANGTDACGRAREVACDRCGVNKRCDAATTTCVCAETDAEMCQRLGKDCGVVSDNDLCGGARTVVCGTCSAGELCSAGNTCEVCTPLGDKAFCAEQGKQCGTFTAQDACSQQSRLTDCGSCEPGFDCDATNQCGACPPETDHAFCDRLDKKCGSVTALDSCRLERTADCGTCTGTDFCDQTQHCHACIPETDASFCQRHHTACGPLVATDNCEVERTVAECGPCVAGAEVCRNSACLPCTPETDAELCGAYFHNCGPLAVVDRCDQARSIASCGTCGNPGQSCQATGACGTSGVPTNDNCTSPFRLLLDSTGHATASGDLANATDDTSGSCSGVAPDLVYAVVLATAKDLRITVTPAHYVYVRSSCGSNEIPDGCAWAPTDAPSNTLSLRAVPAGTYFIWVDGRGLGLGTASAFTLDVVASDPLPPANDVCSSATPLALSGGAAAALGDTLGANDDYSGTCGAMTGPDLVYSLTLAQPAAVVAEVTPDANDPRFRPAVYLRSACTSAAASDEMGCGVIAGSLARAIGRNLPAGTHSILVDGSQGSFGRFRLQAQVLPPITNDTCAGAVTIPINASSGYGSITADNLLGANSTQSTCAPSSAGRSLVFAFTVPAGGPKNAVVEVAPAANSQAAPAISLRSTCDQPSSERACAAVVSPATHELRLTRLDPGTWYLWVDEPAGAATSNPYTLSVQLIDPLPAPSNDLCTSPTSLVPDPVTRTARVSGTTVDASNELAGICGGAGTRHTGPDVVYQFSVRDVSNTVIRVSPSATSPTFQPAVYLRSICGDSATDVGCANASAQGGTATLALTNLAAGTYYLVVDGVAGTAGDFDLVLTSYDAMTNDGCANAKPLAFDANGKATASTDTCSATNDATASCGGWSQAAGNDVVYSFALGAASDVTATLAPGHSGVSALFVRSTCATAATELKCSEANAGATNTLKLRNLAAGTYYLFVDAGSMTCGLFGLEVNETPALPLASNDVCSAAQAITIDSGTGIGTASGNTFDATGDTDGACRAGSGPELVYSFVLTQTKGVEITITPSSSPLQPVAYLRSGCSTPTTEYGCSAAASPGVATVLTAPRLDAGTYYLYVDSYSKNFTGAFDVQVKLTAAAAPANDVCGHATLLEFDNVTNKATASGDTGQALHDDVSYCSTTANLLTGPDLVYYFTLTSPAAVVAKVTRSSTNTVYRPAVSIRSSCAQTDELACARDSSGTSTTSLTLPAGTYYVFVDGITTTTNGTAFGPFTLEVTRSAPLAADGCGNPEPLVVNASTGIATATGTTTSLTNTSDSSCLGSSGSDAVYSLTLSADSMVKLTVDPGTASSGLAPAVYMRSSCADVSTELGCAYTTGTVAPPAVITLNRVPAGTYYVWVDAFSTSRNGAYTLTVQVSAPPSAAPSNDACSGAQPIALDPVSHAAHVTGDTTSASNNYVGTCAGASGSLVYPLAGPDIVYSVSIAQAGTLYAFVQRDAASSTYNPGLYLRSTCGSNAAADELACSAPVSGSGATVTKEVQPGTYYLVVDGQRQTAGAFAMDVVLRAAPSANDTCASAEALTLDPSGTAVVAGDLRGQTDDAFGSCNTTTTGPDVVYSLTLASTKDVSLDLMPGVGLYPMVYVRSSCADVGKETGCIHATSNAPVQLVQQRLAAGTWYIVVDSNSATNTGAFALTVKASDPLPRPANDTCRSPEALTFDSATGIATVNGSTRPGFDDYEGRCRTASAPLDGPDVVYAFTLAARANVTATVTAAAADSGYRPAVYFRSTCDSEAANDEAACVRGTTTSATVATSLPAGTWFVIVDGVARTSGAFTLVVQQSATAVVGDTCADAQALTFASGVATFSGDTANASNTGEGSCRTTSKGDVVYAFTLAADSKVDVNVVPSTGSTLRPYLYVRSTCNDKYGPEFGCVTNYNAAATLLSIPRLAAGTYYLWVDSVDSTAGGAFTGTVTLSATVPVPLNDTCSGATALTFNGTSATVTGDTRLALNDGTGTCAAAFGPDLVYSFMLSADQMVTATVTRDSTTANFQPAVYIRSVCDQSADQMELACGKGSTSGVATASVDTLHAGTYYVWVDGTQTAVTDLPGKFTLVVTLAAPVAGPANDNCSNVTALSFTSGRAVVSLDTTLATDDALNTCSTSYTGPDVVYSFTLTTAQQVSASLVGSSAYSPALDLRRSCGGGTPSGWVACVTQYTGGGTATLTVPYLSAGTYYLWADAGKSATKGSGTLTVSLDAATGTVPPNDTCATAAPLTLGVPVTGTTVNAMGDYLDPPYSAVCAGMSGGANPLGPDVVYSYTPTTTGEFQVVLAPSSTFDPMLIVTEGTCELGSACVAMLSTYGNGTIEKATIKGVAGRTYYVIVDSTMTSKGTFTLFVR